MSNFRGKKVLFVSHQADFQKFNTPLIEMLARAGALVDYASDGAEKIRGSIRRDIKIAFARQPWRLVRHFQAFRQVRKLLENEHYDMIHTHTATASAIVRLANRWVRKRGGYNPRHIPLIYTAHHFQFSKTSAWTNWIWLPIESLLGNFYTDILVTISNGDFATARRWMKRARNVQISGVGVDTAKFRPSMSQAKRTEFRQQFFGASTDDFVIGYVAEMINRKNHEFLLQAFKQASASNPHLKLMLVGKGKNLVKVRQFIKRYHLGGKIKIITEKLPNIAQFYESLELEVSASRREGLGMHLLEALAVGTPVLASQIDGHDKFLRQDQMYKLGDTADLAASIDKIYNVWYNRGKPGREGDFYPAKRKSLMPDKYDVEVSLEEMQKVYGTCLKLSKKPA